MEGRPGEGIPTKAAGSVGLVIPCVTGSGGREKQMRFTGEYAFLSNFYDVRYHGHSIWLDSRQYRTVENAYQAAKSNDPVYRLQLAGCSPGQAKRIGRLIKVRHNWDAIKVGVMQELLEQKFTEPTLRKKLLAIPGQIVENNYWHDTFWGVCKCGKCPPGENQLGKLLVLVRYKEEHR